MMIFYNKRSALRFSQTGERMMLYYFTTLLYHYLMWLAVDAHHVDAVHGHRDAVRLSAVKQRAAYAVDLNRRIGNNPASDVRNAPAQRPRQQPCIRRPQRFLHSDSGNNPASDVRNADALSV